MDKTLRGATEMTAAMTILGTIGLFVVLSGQGAIDVVFWRCAFGALALLVICSAQGLLRRHLTWKKLAVAAVGGVAIVVNWAMLFTAYSEASIGVATAVYNTQPFILVGFGILFLGERITVDKLGWLVIAFAGVLLIVQAKPGAVEYAGSNYALGIALSLGAAFFWAVAALLTKKLTGTPPQLIALVQVCVGILMLAPFVSWNALPGRYNGLGLACHAWRRSYGVDVYPHVWRRAEAADLSARCLFLHLSGGGDPCRLCSLWPSVETAAACRSGCDHHCRDGHDLRLAAASAQG